MTDWHDIKPNKPTGLWTGLGMIALVALLMIWLGAAPCDPSDVRTQLLAASCAGELAQVQSLLREHPDLSTADRTDALRLAAMNGREVVVEELLSKGADVGLRDHCGATALFSAVIPCDGGYGVTRRILAAGAVVDATDDHGRTPLIDAAERGNLEVIEVLLEAGANPGIADSDGKTALSLARAGGHHVVVARLQRVGK